MPTSKSAVSHQRRERLNESVVVDAALALIERDGAESLTFRKLGALLGTAPTAVLRHVRDKDDLLLALGDRMLANVMTAFRASPGGAEGAPWRERIENLAACLRREFIAHPRVSVLISAKTLSRPSEFLAAEILIQALLDAGLAPRDAASTYRVIADTMLAWAAFEASVRALAGEADVENATAWAVRYPALPSQQYPAINAVANHLSEADEEDQYSLTLGILLDGVEARACSA